MAEENAREKRGLIAWLGARAFGTSIVLLWIVASVQCWFNFSYVPGPYKYPYLIGLDNNGYFAFARSLLFDGDLLFANEYRFLAETQMPGTSNTFRILLEKNAVRPVNIYAIGPGLAALPVLAAARGINLAVSSIRGTPELSGFAPLYPFLYMLVNLGYGCAALYLTGRILHRWFPTWAAVFAAWAVLLTGPAFYYFFADIAMSHLPSAFFVTLTFWCWLRWRDREESFAWAAATGLAWGFAVMQRPYNLPLGFLLAERLMASISRRNPVAGVTTMAAGLAAAVGFAPQLIAWRYQHGTWLANTADYQAGLIPVHAFQILLSRRHGLFFWHPALLLAVLGLVFHARSLRSIALTLFLVLAGVVWMYGNWRVWWLGVSFGMRGFVDFAFIFAFGLAAAVSQLAQRFSARVVCRIAWWLTALALVVNLHLFLCFRGGVITVDGPLFWKQTIGDSARYELAVIREYLVWSDFDPGCRASLFMSPRPASPAK